MKILYTDYNDITKHVVLQDVMEHAVTKLVKRNRIFPQGLHFTYLPTGSLNVGCHIV